MNSLDLLTLPVDHYQRYRAAAEIANQIKDLLDLPRLRVLDVGGFSPMPWGQAIAPLVSFLPHDYVITVDLATETLPNYVQASGLALPFDDKAFHLVVSCDTLEHIPPRHRSSFVEELLRVAGHCLALIAPFDSEQNRQAERILHEYLTRKGITCRPLEEHLENGLPSLENLEAMLSERGLAVEHFADGYLPNWLTMSLVTFTPGQSQAFHKSLNRCYNQHLSPGDRRVPAYRRVVLVAQPGNETLVPLLVNALQLKDPMPISSELAFASGLCDALLLTQPSASEVPVRLGALEAENARLRALIADYERGRFMRSMRWLHQLRGRLGKRPRV
jgi:hypothetical protein